MFPFFPDVHGAPFNGPESAIAASPAGRSTWSPTPTSSRNASGWREFVGEFPRMDERYATEPYRHGWMLGMAGGPGRAPRSAMWTPPRGRRRAGRRARTAPCRSPASSRNRQGRAGRRGLHRAAAAAPRRWLVRSLLFDAQRVDEGPVATIHIPMRMRFGLHGNWVHGSHLEAAKEGRTSAALPCVPMN